MKRILSLLLGAAMIFSLFGGVTVSAESTEKLYWGVQISDFDHTSVSFRLAGVNTAQDGTF